MTRPHLEAGRLVWDGVALDDVAATFGTPTYVYSRATLESAAEAFETAFASRPHLVCFAVKANGNLAILDLLARKGLGFDIVSGGELARVLAAGGDPSKVVFAGVGKSEAEIEAALRARVRSINVESAAELERVGEVAARLRVVAPIAVRVNPDVDAKTHPHVTTGLRTNKFGVDAATALELYRRAATHGNLEPVGIACHIGSQLLDLEPFRLAVREVLKIVGSISGPGILLEHLDLGGGLGIPYRGEVAPSIEDYAAVLAEELVDRPHTVIVEPGRALVGPAGLLLTRVEYEKATGERTFLVVDAAMNDLLRPALYDAHHEVADVAPRGDARRVDVAGPVCESADTLARDRDLAARAGDLVAVLDAGAYGMVMASNYNARPRAAEVLLDRGTMHLIRERETTEMLFAGERRLPG